MHDAVKIDRVFESLSFKDIEGGSASRKAFKLERAAIKKWRDLAQRVHIKRKHPEKMTEEEKKFFAMIPESEGENRFADLTKRKRIRFQLGQKDRFLTGLIESGRYLPAMEKTFREKGIPVELTRLPFVESSFNTRARSKVGASGIWQFMRSTGKLFLRVHPHTDERNDPFRATEAAARLLKQNFEKLGNWPLAVTAYNHGPDGIARAAKKVGSERLEDVLDRYHSRRFGFASSNFYSEFLAAVEVEKNAEKYFGKIERLPPLQAVEVEVQDEISMSELIKFLKLDLEKIKDLNPALSLSVIKGHTRIPAGYQLRLPILPDTSAELTLKLFVAGYEQIPALFKRKVKNRFRRRL